MYDHNQIELGKRFIVRIFDELLEKGLILNNERLSFEISPEYKRISLSIELRLFLGRWEDALRNSTGARGYYISENLQRSPGVKDIVMTCHGNMKVILDYPIRLEMEEYE